VGKRRTVLLVGSDVEVRHSSDVPAGQVFILNPDTIRYENLVTGEEWTLADVLDEKQVD
jgi:hypothetical protein